MVDVMAIAMRMEVEGASTVQAVLNRLRGDMDKTENHARGLDRAIAGIGNGLKGLAAGIGVAAIFSRIAAETSEAEFAQAQLAAALRSTGNVAGQTVDELNEHAAALARVSAFDDDVISGAQALLLTFTQIRGPIFKDATQAILNVAQAMGTDLRSATIQVGKALNDPILGVTALARAGIQFSEAQKETIKSLVESNRVMDAQRLILAELETQFAGSAEAARNTFGGALKALGNEIGNLLTVSNDLSTNWLVSFINKLNDAIVWINKELTILGSNVELGVTKVTDAYKLLRAFVDMNATEYAYFSKSLEENRRRLEEQNLALRGIDRQGNVIANIGTTSQVAADFIQKFTGSTLAGASAFQLMSANVLKATAAVRNFVPPQSNIPTKDTTDWKARATEFDKWMAEYQEKQRVAARDAMVARNISNITRVPAAGPRAPVLAVNDEMRAAVRRSVQTTTEIVNTEMAQSMKSFQDQMAHGFGSSLANGIAAGFEVAFTTGSITQGFKALTGTMLSGLGSMLVQFGTKALIANQTIQNMFANMFTPGPQGIAAAAAIIAIGSGLVAAGRSIGAGAAGATNRSAPAIAGGGFGMSGGMTLPGITFGPTTARSAGAAGATNRSAPAIAGGGFGMSGGMTLPGITFGPTTARSASNIVPTANNTFNIIGVNDPSAQRQLQEMLRNADRRGGTTTV